MAYTINKTDGTIFATVQDGTIDNSTSSLVLVGKNYAGWGEALDENFVKLLESHANPTAPTTPHKGQLWFNSSLGILTVYDGSAFKPLAASTPTDTQPETATSVVGDMWYDTINSQLNIYDGNTFIVVGPSFTDSGTTGAVTEIMTDTLSVVHTVIKQYIDSEVVAVFSKDAEFQPIGTDQILNFDSTIYPGIQIANTATPQFTGRATDSDALGSVLAANYLRSDEADEMFGALSIKVNAGLTVGASSEGTFSVTTGDVIINNQTTGDVIVASEGTAVITIDGTAIPANKRASVVTPSGSNILEIANVDYVDTEIDILSGSLGGAKLSTDGSNEMVGNLNIGTGHQILADDGTNALPSISFGSDPNTGIYSAAADTLAMATNGINRLTIESNGTLNVSGTANYETLVTLDDDIPNKKYVDDAITIVTARTGGVHVDINGATSGAGTSGITTSKLATGKYRITHNFGHSNYIPSATYSVNYGGGTIIAARTDNYYDVHTISASHVIVDIGSFYTSYTLI